MTDTNTQDSKENKGTPSSHGVGALLRASRTRLGEDLRSVAANLRIRHVYLQAIEESRSADLPGATYAVGFVRAYSEYLGLDGDEVVRRFKEEYGEAEKRPDLIFPVPVPERSLPTGAILLVSAVLALAAYGGWYALSGGEDSAERVPTLPERLQSLLPGGDKTGEVDDKEPEKTADTTEQNEPQDDAPSGDVVQQVEQSTPVAAEEATTEPEPEAEKAKEGQPVAEPESGEGAAQTPTEPVETAKQPAQEPQPAATEQAEPAQETAQQSSGQQASVEEENEPATAERKEPVEQPETAQTESEKTPETAQPEAPAESVATAAPERPETQTVQPEENVEEASAPVADEGPNRIEVRASQPSWIQVRDEVANSMLVTRLLRPGDVYKVPNRKGLTLLTGNAGALEILVDGKEAPKIGELGAIRRQVALDPEKLLSGEAASE